MERFAYYVVHHRRLVIGVWILLTAFGAFSAGKVADRWLEDFSIPGALWLRSRPARPRRSSATASSSRA